MIRLDKYLADLGIGTRSEVKELIRRGSVTVDGRMVRRPEEKIEEHTTRVCVNGTECIYQKYRYYMLNKPAGVVSATEDVKEKTVLSFLPAELQKDIFPVGRLDKDTVGLLLLTNDGGLAHELLSPKKHVPKTYLVQAEHPVDEVSLERLKSGVDIGEKNLTLPAEASYGETREWVLLTIREGRYHQVKRMFQAVGNRVVSLKRLSMGTLTLDETLPEGRYRELTAEEVKKLTDRKV
ncbi:MAG: rRNA pseudouridine synthase [Lachnospiraceae bacterium]|nr:rRNA pseudouridine synthase [Lachnospiraceae bacterium]